MYSFEDYEHDFRTFWMISQDTGVQKASEVEDAYFGANYPPHERAQYCKALSRRILEYVVRNLSNLLQAPPDERGNVSLDPDVMRAVWEHYSGLHPSGMQGGEPDIRSVIWRVSALKGESRNEGGAGASGS